MLPFSVTDEPPHDAAADAVQAEQAEPAAVLLQGAHEQRLTTVDAERSRGQAGAGGAAASCSVVVWTVSGVP